MPTKASLGAVLIALTLSATAHAQVSPAALSAVDANGSSIGPVIDFSPGQATVAVLAGGHAILVVVRRTSLSSLFGGAVSFTSSDCTGQGYVSWPADQLGDPQTIVTTVSSIWAGPRTALQIVTPGSHLFPGVDGCQPAVGGGSISDAVPVGHIADLLPGFQPPFDLAGAAGPSPASVPAVTPGGLALLAAALAAFAFVRLKRTA